MEILQIRKFKIMMVVILLLPLLIACVPKNDVDKVEINSKPIILLRSSWQTVNIGDIAHTPGVLALCEKYLPGVEVRLWAGDVGDGVQEMLLKRFPDLQIILNSDSLELKNAFNECDFLLHGSGPYLVADKDVDRWIKETQKPFGVYGITLPDYKCDENIIQLLNQAEFVYFRDTVSLEFAKTIGIKAPVMEFGPDGAFACDVRNDSAAIAFMSENKLEEGKFLCVIPKYRKTPYWVIPEKNTEFNQEVYDKNERFKEHDLKPYREAIIEVVSQTDMKILICPEDKTQMALGKEMLYDPLPDHIKPYVVWHEKFWLTDEALSTYVRSAGLFGLEQHSPIMCIGNGVPALVGRFKEQSCKGFMWHNIGLKDWLFDSDVVEDMQGLTPTVLSLVNDRENTMRKTLEAKKFVEEAQKRTMIELRKNLKYDDK